MIKKADIINSLPGLFTIKNLNSRFTAFSPELAKLTGWKSVDDAIGKTDYDTPSDLAEFAEEFIKLDKKVIDSGQRMVAIDIQHYTTGWGIMLTEKKPITNENNEIVGLFNTLIDVSNIDFFKFYLKFHTFNTKLSAKGVEPTSYVLTDFHNPLPLTEKQENCLFYLIRGKTIKEIAKFLKISPRTVECHLDAIKIKLNCQNKSEIIEKAIDSGFLFYIPKYFQKN